MSRRILKYPQLYYKKKVLLDLNIFSGFQHDRTRVIYKYALDKMPKETCQEIYKAYTVHEKKYGDRAGIEDVIVSKRKFQYEEVNILLFLSDLGTIFWKYWTTLKFIIYRTNDSPLRIIVQISHVPTSL